MCFQDLGPIMGGEKFGNGFFCNKNRFTVQPINGFDDEYLRFFYEHIF